MQQGAGIAASIATGNPAACTAVAAVQVLAVTSTITAKPATCGVIGTALGDGRGLGTVVGAIGGAMLGDKAESNANSQPVTTCTTQAVMENRLVGYTVVYEYAGKTYNVQLPQDPGPTIAIQVTPVGMLPAAPAPAPQSTTVVTPQVVYTPPPVVYAPPPVYYRPWPVNTSINLGWGWYGGGHRHWR